jgi:hypothetical protein
MSTFKYISFTCEYVDLEARLNQYGSQGWRLHTCEPVPTIGPHGSGTLHAFVVMDMLYQTENRDEYVAESRSEGIAMTG